MCRVTEYETYRRYVKLLALKFGLLIRCLYRRGCREKVYMRMNIYIYIYASTHTHAHTHVFISF